MPGIPPRKTPPPPPPRPEEEGADAPPPFPWGGLIKKSISDIAGYFFFLGLAVFLLRLSYEWVIWVWDLSWAGPG